MKKSLFRGFKTRALALSISAISANMAISVAGYAQDEALEEIQITGSRIRTTNGMATPTPVTAITFTELQDIDPGGVVSEQIGSLPQFFGTQSSQRGSGALFGEAGGSYLNMRSLGANRTLILLDGSRVVPGAKTGSVNVDTLPNALIRTVDVVTGGASAAYGADAVGGVTNFILDRQFQGLKINAGTGVSERGDGERYNFSVAGGKQFGDRLNVIASFDSKYINQYERDAEDLDPDFYKRWGLVTNPAYKASDPPGTNPQRLTLPWVTSSYSSPYGLIGPGPAATAAQTAQYNSAGLNRMKFLPDGSGVTPFINGDVVALAGTASMSGGPEAAVHNRAFNGDRGAEAISRSGFVGLRYDVTDNIEVYGQALVGRSESNTDYRQSSYELGGLGSMTIFRDNAYLPASVAAAMDRATPPLTSIRVEKHGSFVGVPEIGANQRDQNVLSTESWSVGFNATLTDNWDLSGNWQSGESEKLSQIFDLTRIDRMYLSLDAIRNPATGAIQCRVQVVNPTPAQLAASPSVAGKFTDVGDWEIAAGLRDPSQRVPLASPIGLDNTIRDCVPHNVMGNGNISQAAIDYIGTDKRGIGTIEQDFAEVLLRGEVYEGWGYGPVSFAGGVNYREQSMTDGASPLDVEVLGPPLNDPALGIQGIATNYTGGSANLHAFSTVPLLRGEYDVKEVFAELQAPIWESASGNQSVGGTVAARKSDYSRTGKVDSWKIGVEFQVFEDLRLRATKSRDVREPTFSERLDAQGGGGTVTDSSRPADGNVSITTVSGGNPNLNPELANTNVIGLVYQPSWADGLQFSTDWYEVDINGAVGQLGAQRIVDECNAGSLVFCPNVERETPSGGKIIRVFNYFLNVASQRVEGVDAEISYRMEPDFFSNEFESLSIRALGGYIMERSNIATPGAASIEFDGQTATPNFTALISSTYSLGPVSFQLQMRHIDSTSYNNAQNTALWHSGVEIDDATVSSSTWFNGQVGYNGEMSNGSTWNVALNVQNLFDRNPPVIASFNNRGGSQTLDDNYDLEGRRYQLSLNYNF